MIFNLTFFDTILIVLSQGCFLIGLGDLATKTGDEIAKVIGRDGVEKVDCPNFIRIHIVLKSDTDPTVGN